MKVGLLTVYYSNYGSFFQTVAMVKAIEKLGHECEIINASIRGKYILKFMIGSVGEHILPRVITDKIAEKNVDFAVYHAVRKELEELKVGPIIFSGKALSKHYDCVVVGSDVLWDATEDYMHFIPEYFGIGLSCPHFAYGTSGVNLNLEVCEHKEEIIEGFKSFSNISVRDSRTQELIKSLIDKEPTRVLDPTLLNPYFAKEGIGGNGILVYGQHFTSNHIKLIKTFAKENNMAINALCWNHEWCDEFIKVSSATEFQEYFSRADFCIVSTFHGTIFSILHRRPFAAFAAPVRTGKISCLLEDVDMKECFWNEDCNDTIEFKGDYNRADAAIEKSRDKSMKYLKNALEEV